jgi:hypothetical protein
MADRTTRILFAVLLCVVTGIYSQHFDNSFQFDDSHTIVENSSIRSLTNWSRFFTDSATFSNSPHHRTYRPLLTLTLAIDYAIAGKLDPFVFHLQSFCWFLMHLGVMLLFFRELLQRLDFEPARANSLSLFAVAWYGLHPVQAETVNYLIQRGDILSTLAVTLAVFLYLKGRNFLALVAGVLGCLAKQSALVFPVLSLLTLWLVYGRYEFGRAFRQTIPACILAGFLFYLQQSMTAATFEPGGPSRWLYLLTQPSVIGHYTLSFFLPLWLSADSDWKVVSGPWEPQVITGAAFLLCFVSLGLYSLRKPALCPVGFGIFWMLVALAPTSSVIPWAEVMNDHRMFFPFVGLSLAIVTLCSGIFSELVGAKCKDWQKKVAVVLLLLPYACATYERNEVWHDDLSLWGDAAEKSPKNGRALMNLGNALMRRGQYEPALALFNQAREFNPNYYVLETNLGVIHGALGKIPEAHRHFLRAIALKPNASKTYFFYARFLIQQGDFEGARRQLEMSRKLNPTDVDVQELGRSIGGR